MDDFASWAAEVDTLDGAPVATVERQKFPCSGCAGTGEAMSKPYGRAGIRYKRTCPACKGKGHFLTAPEFRAKAKASRAQTKARKVERLVNEHKGMVEKLLPMCEWNSFAQSLVSQIQSGKPWSDNQVSAAQRMIDKVEARQAERAQKAAEKAVSVDLEPIRTMFASAVENGHKRPKYRAEGLVISMAPANGVNAGALYVKTTSDEYQGKIVGDEFKPAFSCDDVTKEALKVIAKDPSEAAVRYGRKTGSCSCCGRELTKAASIEAGIGPICAEKWGF